MQLHPVYYLQYRKFLLHYQITEEQFRNDYKDTFEILLEHTITSLVSLNNTENDIVRLRDIYNVLDIQYNIYISGSPKLTLNHLFSPLLIKLIPLITAYATPR